MFEKANFQYVYTTKKNFLKSKLNILFLSNNYYLGGKNIQRIVQFYKMFF